MTRKHLIDTDLYVDLIQSGRTLPLIGELYDTQAPGIYFCSVVAQELLAGARSARGRKSAMTLFVPFERARRIVTPTHAHWKDAGDVIAQLFRRRPDLRTKLPSLLNDCLIALCARSLGATLYTGSAADFFLLRQYRPFSLFVVQ